MEIWKDVTGFEGLYQVSDSGLIKSLPKKRTLYHGGQYTMSEKIILGRITRKGYRSYSLKKDGAESNKFGHRMVAEAFIPNPNNKNQINHVNCDKLDNRVENLEWCTNGENQIHSYKNGKVAAYKNRFGKDHNQSRPVLAEQNGEAKLFENITRASEFLGVTIQAVWNALNGKTQKCKGYSFKYAA